MKSIIAAALGITIMASSVYAEAEIKRVCVDKFTNNGQLVKDKNGKVVQECKDIKIHKKLEGTKVPEKK
jgi:hypothetical protein